MVLVITGFDCSFSQECFLYANFNFFLFLTRNCSSCVPVGRCRCRSPSDNRIYACVGRTTAGCITDRASKAATTGDSPWTIWRTRWSRQKNTYRYGHAWYNMSFFIFTENNCTVKFIKIAIFASEFLANVRWLSSASVGIYTLYLGTNLFSRKWRHGNRILISCTRSFFET